LLGVVVEGIAQIDHGAEALLGFCIEEVDIVLILACSGAVLDELQLVTETTDIGLVHLFQRRRHIGRCRRVAAQLLQRHQDLIGAALRAAELHLFGFGGGALGADEVFMDAGVVAADVAQIPGDVGIDGLPVGVTVELRHAAHLLVEQLGNCGVEHGIVGDDFSGGILAHFGRAVDRLVDGVAQRVEFHVQLIDAGADRYGIVECAGQVPADRIHLVARGISVLAEFLVELLAHRRIDRGRAIEDVGGKAALRVHVARDITDRAHHLQPALRHRDLLHGLKF
jgi:hypothetical protein